MNRKNGYGVVTTNRLITVDKAGRTARHLEGRIRLDYMNETHYWVIVDQVQHMGDSFPPPDPHPFKDCGQIWIPDHMVASIRWYEQDW